MRSISSEAGPKRGLDFWDFTIVVALATFGVANLALPEDAQSIFGVHYLFLTIAITAIAVIVRLPVNTKNPTSWVVVIVLMLGSLPGFVAGPISAYGLQKAQTIVLIALSLLAAASIRDLERAIIRLSWIGVGVGTLFSLLIVTGGVVADNGRVSVLELNPIGVARLAMLGAVLALVYFVAPGRTKIPLRLVMITVVLIGTAATFITGSRGPLLAGAVAVVLVALSMFGARRLHPAWPLAGAVALTLLIQVGVVDTNGLFGWATSREDAGRETLFSSAWGLMLENPFGVGWGNFGYVYGTPGASIYPHNLYLEVGVEGGVLSLAAFSIVTLTALVWAVGNYLRARRTADLLLLAMYMFALMNSQFSSDLVGNRMLWMALALVIARRMETVERPVTVATATLRTRSKGVR